MGSYSLPYALSLGELTGWIVLTAVFVAGVMDFRRRRRELNEVFPLPLTSRWVRLGVLQQYVLLETVAPVLLSILALTFFMLIREIYRLIDLLMANWSVGLILQMILAKLPMLFSFTVPIAILIGVLLGIGRMAVENEIRACQTAGVHLMKIFGPMIVICAVLTATMIVVNYEYAPLMEKKVRRLMNRLMFEVYCAAPAGMEFEIPDDPLSYVLFYGKRDPKTGDMLQVRMLVEREAIPETEKKEEAATQATQSASQPAEASTAPAEVASAELNEAATQAENKDEKKKEKKEKKEDLPPERDLVVARRGIMNYNPANDELVLSLINGSVHSAKSDPPDIEGERPSSSEAEMVFDSMNWPMTPKKKKKKETEYRTSELIGALIAGRDWEVWKNEDKDDYEEQRTLFKIELARRTAFPFACLAFVLLGIPLAIFTRPSGKSISITMALILIWVYYWMVQWGTGMAEDGKDLGLLIVFLPNLLMAGLGLILFRRAVRL